MSALAAVACWRRFESRTRPHRRRRPRLCRPAARRGARQGRVPRHRHRPRRSGRSTPIIAGRSYIPTWRPPTCRRCATPASSTRPTDFSVVKELDTINICVPTPLRKTKDPDMSYIVSAVEAIAKHLHPGMLIVLESTTYPGHDRRSRAADARGHRAQGRRGLLPRVLARARRSGQPDVPDPQHAEGRRRHHAGLLEARGARSTARRSRRSCRSARRASPRWSSCSRTPSARSTSAWSTSWR